MYYVVHTILGYRETSHIAFGQNRIIILLLMANDDSWFPFYHQLFSRPKLVIDVNSVFLPVP